MERSTLEWFDVLARGLIWAAGIVLILSVIGAAAVATSSNSLPFAEDVQREGRGIAAIAAIGGGIATSALLAGIGAILRLMLVEPLESARAADAVEPEGRRPDTGDPSGR